MFQNDFIRREGYPVETHNVTTPDGFKLVMFRIPYGKKSKDNVVDRAPVLIVHGILCSSTDWVISGANNSLGNFYTYIIICQVTISANLIE